PNVGTLEREQLRGAGAKSNEVLRQLGPDIQWVESYVADNKTFCVYLAKDEAIIRKPAELSGFPATKITEGKKMIDPTTEAACTSRAWAPTATAEVMPRARRERLAALSVRASAATASSFAVCDVTRTQRSADAPHRRLPGRRIGAVSGSRRGP